MTENTLNTEAALPVPEKSDVKTLNVQSVNGNATPAGGIEVRVPIEEMRKRKLFLATPMYGGMAGGMFSRSIADLSAVCAKYGIELKMYFLFNESLITRARNYCCDEFMRSGSTHMLFLDADIGFNPDDVMTMLAMQSDDSPYDVLGAPYPKKCIAWEKIKKAVDKGFADENPNNLDRFVGDYVFNPKNGSGAIPIHQPAEVMEIGTGFMMIRRKTLEVFNEKYPYMLYRPDHVRTEHFDGSRLIMSYFDCTIDRGYSIGDLQDLLKSAIDGKITPDELIKQGKEMLDRENKASRRYLSEDYKFCYDAAKAGLKVWLCPWMRTQHTGTFVFGGSLLDLAQLGAAATADVGELDKIKKAIKAGK
jgi:hypothetical protein